MTHCSANRVGRGPTRERLASRVFVALVAMTIFVTCKTGDDDCTPSSAQNECATPGEACAPGDGFARFCAIQPSTCSNVCLNVCNNPTSFARESVPVGGTCAFDADCASGSTCDNDVVGGGATCKCVSNACVASLNNVAFNSPTLLGECTAAHWVHDFGSGDYGDYAARRTCMRTDGTCTENEKFDFALGRSTADLEDICMMTESKAVYTGQLCGSDYAFAEHPENGEYETGVYHFATATEIEAEWVLYDHKGGTVVAKCKGKARGKQAGSPDDALKCTDYDPFPFFADGTFMERYNCVTGGTCVDPDRSGSVTVVRGSGTSYTLSSGSGMWSGTGTLVGRDLAWTATYHDPGAPSSDYTETGTFVYQDSDHFTGTSTYTITGTGVKGQCTASGRRAASPGPPPALPPCP